MFKEHYHIIGVMSGTSLDGIDLAQLYFSIDTGKWSFKIMNCETITYPQNWLDKLKIATTFSNKELENLNIDYTRFLGETIRDFIKKYQIVDIDAVSSHGHTILHQPKNGITLQIGNLPEIATFIEEKVVCDFRVQDVKLGGQGAPLVPIGDRYLFSEFELCLNLGGFSNVSFEQNNKRIAFDILPVNTVLNFYANQLGLEYDDKGKIAKSGKLDIELLSQLNELAYYKKQFPKSLGFEFVKETILPLMENTKCSLPDKLHTFIEHIAQQTHLSLSSRSGKILITGGGAYNEYLIQRFHFYLQKLEIIIPNKQIIEYKEALLFGFLGVLKLRNEINVLSSVTGATQDHSSGKIFEKNV